VIDKNVPTKFKSKFVKNLKSSLKKIYIFNANEKNKNQKNVELIQKILFKNRFNRDDCLIAFGGGITGDVVGYCASTYKRGIKFINIPTTLLSQVDSSIGGKTGINNTYGKNLVGSFYQPSLVVSDLDVLKSLNTREIICGYAEILKSSLLDSLIKFKYLDKNFKNIINLKQPFIGKAILNSCKLKKKIVQKDETEKNLRKVLNLGHTFAHAYESKLSFSNKLNHGEAVIIGIKNALAFSYKYKLLKGRSYNLIMNHINKIPFKKKFKELFKIKDVNKIISFMKSDKKNNSKNINIILFKNFGKK
jgi:3-dehydroquinate synthetase